MLQMNPTAVTALQSTVDEITNLSYRIREWEKRETYLQKTFSSFQLYASKLQHAPSNWSMYAPILRELWSTCYDMDVPELNGFVQNLKHIHQPSEFDITTSSPNLHDGVAALVDIGGVIYEALRTDSFGKVQEQSHAFQTVLTGQLTTRQSGMNEEVEQFWQAVHELHEHLMSTLRSETQST